jgi:hypothetical protein
MTKQVKMGLAAIVIAIAVAAVLFLRKAKVKMTTYGTDGLPNPPGRLKPPTTKGIPDQHGVDEGQPPVDPGVKTKVVLTVSGVAGVYPYGVVKPFEAVGLTAISAVFGHNAYMQQRPAYTETGIEQISYPNLSFKTNFGFGMYQATHFSGIQKAVIGLMPLPADIISALNWLMTRFGNFQALADQARTEIAFMVSAPPATAVNFMLKSALMNEIRQAQDFGVTINGTQSGLRSCELYSTKIV